MSKIKNGGLDQYGTEPFEQQQFGTAGVKGVKQLGQYASSPGHRGLAVTQNSPFSALAVTVTITTHYAYPHRDGQAELT